MKAILNLNNTENGQHVLSDDVAYYRAKKIRLFDFDQSYMNGKCQYLVDGENFFYKKELII